MGQDHRDLYCPAHNQLVHMVFNDNTTHDGADYDIYHCPVCWAGEIDGNEIWILRP